MDTRTPYPHKLGVGGPVADDGGVTFGAVLRRLRLAARLSQEALAERARMSVEAISALERGVRQAPQRQTLRLLMEGLGLDGTARTELEAAAVRPVRPRDRGGSISAFPGDKHRLPVSLSSFVGRERELSAISQLLTTNPLVTLVGPGGVGKSRLAIETARSMSATFDAIYVIELAPISDPNLVVQAVAGVLGLREEPPAPLLQTLSRSLDKARALLVVDNCEHVLDSVAELTQSLMQYAPTLRIVATSREALRVDGERLFEVRPLQSDGPAELLFVDRAQSAAQSLIVSENDWSALNAICRRLDGIPLAIELAAAHAATFDLATLAKRLEQRFTPLTSASSRTALPHHRTLRALFDWSYDLLGEDERRVFRRLGTFAGGWTLESAEFVTVGDDVKVALFDIMSRLHAKSLLQVDHHNGTRFRLLQTMRDYSLEKLEESGERSEVEMRHAVYYLALAGESEMPLRDGRQNEAVSVVNADMDNIRAALDVAERSPTLEKDGLRCLSSLGRYWILTGTMSEGRDAFKRFLNRELDPSPELSMALSRAAIVALNERHAKHRRIEDAKAYAHRAMEVADRLNDSWMRLHAEVVLLMIRAFAEEDIGSEVIAITQRAAELANPWISALALFSQGLHAANTGDRAGGRSYMERSIQVARDVGDGWHVATSSLPLARYLIDDDPIAAAKHVLESANFFGSTHHLTGLALCAELFTEIAIDFGEYEMAVRFLAAASTLRDKAGMADLDAAAKWKQRLLTALNEVRFQSLWQEAREVDVPAIVELSMGFVDGLRREASV